MIAENMKKNRELTMLIKKIAMPEFLQEYSDNF